MCIHVQFYNSPYFIALCGARIVWPNSFRDTGTTSNVGFITPQRQRQRTARASCEEQHTHTRRRKKIRRTNRTNRVCKCNMHAMLHIFYTNV